MTKRENRALVKTINRIKKDWIEKSNQLNSAPEGSREKMRWGRTGGFVQAHHNDLLALIFNFGLTIPCNKELLPENTKLDTFSKKKR